MQSLEALMGLGPNGIPSEYQQYPDDMMLQYGMNEDEQALMNGVGVPALQDPYALVGMQQPTGQDPTNMLTRKVLGGAVPQLSQQEINALAQAIGVGTQNTDPMVDPMYAPQFDIMTLLGGR